MIHIIFSDIQGNYAALERFSNGVRGFNRDKTLCLGDIVNDGSDYEDNRVLGLLRDFHDLRVLRGNHEESALSQTNNKLAPGHRRFLLNLPTSLSVEDIVAYHSSLSHPGERLLTQRDIEEEAEVAVKSHPNKKFFVFGHSHVAGAFKYDPVTKAVKKITPSKGIELEAGAKYFINPGGLGLYYGLPQTFAVLDSQKRKLDFYTLNELGDMDIKRRVLSYFEESVIPYISGDEWSYSDLEKQVGELSPLNVAGILDKPIRIMRSFQPDRIPKSQRRRYFSTYSQELIDSLQKFATPEVLKNYSVRDMAQLRKHYLKK